MIKKNKGFLLVAAVFLLIAGSFVTTIISRMVTLDFASSSDEKNVTQAFYIATSGLQIATYKLTATNVANRIACSDITGDSEFTNVSFSDGAFTVTATSHAISSATLSSAITNLTTIIPVSSASSYAQAGQIMIDKEKINYTNSSTNSANCSGNAPCLLGVTRGADATTAAAHSSSTLLSQSYCHLTSTGAVPDLTNPKGKREVSQDVFGSGSGEGWAVGNKLNKKENIFEWMGNSWQQYGPSNAIADKNLEDIFMLNPSDGWAVGQKNAGSGLTLHWDGSNWTETGSAHNADLLGVTCVTGDDCWAVGKKDGKNAKISHWNGGAWSAANLDKDIPKKEYRSISCISSNDCWAVGQKDTEESKGKKGKKGKGKNKDKATVIHWDGSKWTLGDSGKATQDLNGISCLSSGECWAVGDKETFIYWNGSKWSDGSVNNNVPDKSFKDVNCNAIDNCWAVGDAQGGDALLAQWNGSQWSRVLPDASVSNQNLYGVNCINNSNCWAAGNSGSVTHWNGISWTDASTGIGNTKYNAIYVLGNASGSVFITNWDEDQ
jgi:hypothetical protein